MTEDKGWYELSNKIRKQLKDPNCLFCRNTLSKRVGPRKFFQDFNSGFCSRACYVNFIDAQRNPNKDEELESMR